MVQHNMSQRYHDSCTYNSLEVYRFVHSCFVENLVENNKSLIRLKKKRYKKFFGGLLKYQINDILHVERIRRNICCFKGITCIYRSLA